MITVPLRLWLVLTSGLVDWDAASDLLSIRALFGQIGTFLDTVRV